MAAFLKTAAETIQQAQERLTPPPKRRWPIAIAAGLISGPAWALIIRLIDTQSVRQTFFSLASPSLWLTALFLGLITLALTLLAHSLFAGNLIVGAVGVVLALVNYFKVMFTTVPLTIWDFALAGRLGNIVDLNRTAITFSRNTWLALLAALLWLAAALFFSGPLRLRWRWSALAGLAPALAFSLIFWVGADPLVFSPLQADVSQDITQAAANDRCGMALGLWRALLRQANRKLGSDYSPDHMEQVAAQAEGYAPAQAAQADRQRPNIILVLSESFFDVTGLDGVTYGTDPVAEFHALQKEGVSGAFYTRTLGYGTADIEAEILSGINTALLSGENLYSMDPEAFTRLPTVPALLRNNGYTTTMFHVYGDGTYNRSNYYYELGFDEIYFSTELDKIYPAAAEAEEYWAYVLSRVTGLYYSDDLMADLFISLYEKRRAESDAPMFLFGISIENHSPYEDKYSEEELNIAAPQSPLAGEAANNLLHLSQGARDASAALGRIVDYFRTVDEPTVIIFYGDHRPGLGLSEGGTVYSELGMVPADSGQWSLEDIAGLYSTDYLIWSNDPDYLPGEPGSTAEASSNYLGLRVLEAAGVELPLYWRCLDRLSRYRCIDTTMYHRSAAGELTYAAPTEGEDGLGLSLMTDLLYDAIYGKQYVTDQLN